MGKLNPGPLHFFMFLSDVYKLTLSWLKVKLGEGTRRLLGSSTAVYNYSFILSSQTAGYLELGPRSFSLYTSVAFTE